MLKISIHAPRVGSDIYRHVQRPPLYDISIHAPRVGSDYIAEHSSVKIGISIHAPRVGSDPCQATASNRNWHFNPRSPCGERRGNYAEYGEEVGISIHAPRVGSDADKTYTLPSGSRFQSTLPVWGATSVKLQIKRR